MTPQDASEVVPFLTSAATIAFLQKMLKQTQPYAQFVQAFPGADKWAHRTFAAVASLLVAAGIHITWNWNAASGGAFSGTLPSLLDALHGLGDFWKVYILQHTVYSAAGEAPYHPPPQKGA